jgi:exodeoxyribonuclease VII small subunit
MSMTETPPAGEQTYEAAAARVEQIIRRLDSGEASLGETLDLVKEGKRLIEYCAGELEAVGGALEELRLDELVARLERDASPRGKAGDGADTGGRAGHDADASGGVGA